ncbi:MAG: hypothetical protein ACXACI_13235 [Candidatus Hodarchaeales archaeon]|jgi:hypothetical protein
MKDGVEDRKKRLHLQNIRFLAGLIAITALFHMVFLTITKTSDIDLSRFLTRSNAVLDGKTSYQDEPLLSDPKPLWTYILAGWLFLCRSIAEILFNVQTTDSYDELYAKILIIAANLIMVLVIFLASRDLLSLRSAYLASCFYAINLFPLILASAAGKYDVIPALFVLLAVWMAAKSRTKGSAIFLAIGTSFKYIAGLPLPILLIFLGKRERSYKAIFIYLTLYCVTCLAIAAPFLLINAERFIDSTIFFFIERKTHGPHSIFHPFYWIPHQLLLLFPLTLIGLICLYIWRKEEISNYDLFMILFITISFFCFTNKAFLPQYFLYSIPYLAMVFPSMFPNRGSRHLRTGDPFLATTAFLIPNFFALNFLGYFISINSTNFDDLFIHSFADLNFLRVFDFTWRYDFVGIIDGRILIICFILVLNIALSYFLDEPKLAQLRFLDPNLRRRKSSGNLADKQDGIRGI